MKRKEFEALGDKHKHFESIQNQQLIPSLPIVVRLDGRAFHTFTKGIKKPFDERLTRCMVETSMALLKESNAVIAYTQSDEITLVLAPSQDNMYFGGRSTKINTILASLAGAVFNKLVAKYLPEKSHLNACFDSRCFQYPTEELVAECLLWRETDATRNSVSMAACSLYSNRDLEGKNVNAKLDMLLASGVNWNDYPAFFKRGTYIARRETVIELSEADYLDRKTKDPRAKQSYIRNQIMELDMPPFSKVINQCDVIFRFANPEVNSELL